MRHTFCRRLYEGGASLATIADLAGHANLDTTRRYIMPGEEERQDAVDMLSRQRHVTHADDDDG